MSLLQKLAAHSPNRFKASRLPDGWRWQEGINWRLLLLTLTLSSIGFVVVTSASMSYAEGTYGDVWYFTKNYLVYWAMGVLGAFMIAAVPLSIWENYGGLMLILALLLLSLVLIPGLGRSVNGSQRWLQFGPLSVQASEVVKVCVIIFYSSFLARRGAEMLEDWRGVFKPLVILGAIVFLLMLEPDFGASVVLIGTVMAMLFVAGVRLWQFILLFALALGGLALLATQSAYRMKRLVTFLDPWADQFNSGYQLTQSLIAFGRGEWFGLGLGNSVQKLFYLPEAHTDFVFAIIAEELGLVGVITVIGIFILLIITILNVAKKALQMDKKFSSFAAFGISIMFIGQAFINLGVASGLLPTKGLTMPFISYGGSSLLATCALLAIVMRIHWELSLAAVTKHPVERQPLSREESSGPGSARAGRRVNSNTVTDGVLL